jgi:hypothetical protein
MLALSRFTPAVHEEMHPDLDASPESQAIRPPLASGLDTRPGNARTVTEALPEMRSHLSASTAITCDRTAMNERKTLHLVVIDIEIRKQDQTNPVDAWKSFEEDARRLTLDVPQAKSLAGRRRGISWKFERRVQWTRP